MKKIVSFLLALVLTLSLTTNALAAVVSPKADATEITADQTVKLTVTASEEEKLTGIVCLNYRVYFDPAFFELDAAASVAKFEGAKLTALKTDDRGSYYAVSLLDTTSAGLTVSGDLYTLAFKAKAGAKAGDTSKLTLVKAYVYTIEDGAMKPMDNGAVENGEVTVKIISAAPANVTLTGAKAVSGGIQVTWQKAANAATYNVYRMGPGDTHWKVVSAKQSGTSYTDKNVTAGSTYKYTVRGVAADGKTLSPGFNNTGVSATMPKPVTAPANVTLGSAKAVTGGIQVTWQAAAGAATYNVYRMGPGDTNWKVVSAKQSGTSYTDKNVTAGSTYKYTVRGVAADGKTLSPGFNNTGVSATMPKPVTAPANVTLGSAKAVTGGIQVTWQAAAGAATYNVYRMGPGDTNWKVVSVKQSGTSYTDKNVTAGSTYKYTVRGVAADGKTLSPSYNKTGVSATMPKPAPTPTTPAEVTLIGAVAGSDGITVKWKAAAGAKEYRVYRKGPGETKWKGLINVTGISWTDRDVKAGAKYTYTVRGIGADGKTLSPTYNNVGVSTTATVTPKPIIPADVTLIDATAGSGGIQVTWKTAAGAKEYRVYRKGPGETKWKGLINVTGTGWTDTNVTKGVKYTYTVRGISVDGKLSRGYDTTGVSAIAK